MKRRVFTPLILGFLTAGFFLFYQIRSTLVAGKQLTASILNSETESYKENYFHWQKKFRFWERTVGWIGNDFFRERWRVSEVIYFIRQMNNFLPEVLGVYGRKTYFVLFQNNMELRPTGGFIGSYGKFIFQKGVLEKMTVSDIYVPDGQLEGHVDPPPPIQKAFKQGWFKLRDANFDPDFYKSAQAINWFFEKGKEEKGDGIVAINLNLIEDLLKVTGVLNLPDYDLKVDAENFYQITQSFSETDFFPGSTQKENVMSSLSRAIMFKFKELNSGQWLRVLRVLYKNLQERQIFVYSQEERMENLFSQMRWDGTLGIVSRKEKIFSDYLYLVEANLGANKANCCVSRQVDHEITILSDKIKERVQILFNNTSKYSTQQALDFWGGDYVNYQRLYLPGSAENISVMVDGQLLPEENLTIEKRESNNLISIGFFITVPLQGEKNVQIFYEFPVDNNLINYKLLVQKQPGIKKLPYRLILVKDNARKIIFNDGIESEKKIGFKI